jgi:hypothetical protein
MLVHTLLCESHLWFAVPCLRSLLTLSQDPIQLAIHDDGSLAAAAIERLASAFPGAILIPRRVADAEIAEALAHFPHMAAARTYLPHVIKLLDMTLIQRESQFVRYLDSDVFFRRRFRGLFPASEHPASGAFLMDTDNSFAAHPLDVWPFGPLRLACRLNSGLFWIRRDRIDPERMEYLFKRWGPRRVHRYHGWFEQTIWADQAWRAGCLMFDPAQLGNETGQPDHLIGVHFVTPMRKLFRTAVETDSTASAEAPSGEIEEIRLRPAMPYRLPAAIVVSLKHISAVAFRETWQRAA